MLLPSDFLTVAVIIHCGYSLKLLCFDKYVVMQEHWFALRKIDGDWWNLNSLLRAPQPLSQFYLSAYLDSLREQGYSIFVVQGLFPSSSQEPLSAAGDGPGRWYTPEEASTLETYLTLLLSFITFL